MHGSPVSDSSSLHSDSGIMNDCNGIGKHTRSRRLDNALYSQCVTAMCTLTKDPSPRITGLGRRLLSIIGIEQVVTKSVKSSSSSAKTSEALTPPINILAGLARSSSWFDMNAEESSLLGFSDFEVDSEATESDEDMTNSDKEEPVPVVLTPFRLNLGYPILDTWAEMKMKECCSIGQ